MRSLLRHPNYYKNKFTFFLPSIRMKKKNIIFNDEKINESNFCKNKKLSKIDDIDVNIILVSKEKKHMVKKAHLNTLLDIMEIVSLDHYE